jgi:hypothetical protein
LGVIFGRGCLWWKLTIVVSHWAKRNGVGVCRGLIGIWEGAAVVRRSSHDGMREKLELEKNGDRESKMPKQIYQFSEGA